MAVSHVRRIGFGTLIAVRPSTFTAGGSTVFVNIANIVEPPSGPDATAADIDTHTLDDGVYETHSKGSVNPGTGTTTIRYDPEDDSGRVLADLLAQTDPVPQWRVTFASVGGSTVHIETFSAHLMSIGREMPKNGMIQTTIGFQGSGAPGYTTST